MARFITALTAGLLLAGTAIAASAPASAQSRYCPTRESFFGTIQSVQGNTMIVRTDSGHSGTIMLDNNAQINAHGYAMRPGTFVRALGCEAPNGVFQATEVSLAADSPESAAAERREPITRSGKIVRISSSAIYVWDPAYHTEMTWIVRDADRFRTGERVVAQGTENTRGDFFPSSVRIIGEAETRPSVTLSGVVRRVTANAIYVWEPAYRTETIWVVRDADRFRVGERVVGRGTENRKGDFFPSTIQFQ